MVCIIFSQGVLCICVHVQRRTTRKRGQESTRITPTNEREQQRDRIVRRAALEFHNGMYGEQH